MLREVRDDGQILTIGGVFKEVHRLEHRTLHESITASSRLKLSELPIGVLPERFVDLSG